MVELQRLRSDHAAAILAFELANRAYFSVSITDRGDEFFEEFPERHRAHLAEQDAGVSVCHLLLDEKATVVGRLNLHDLTDGTTEVGYRVAEEVAGRGVATAALREVCRLAAEQYGLRTLTAKTSNENVASRRVLEKAGFVPVGPTDVGGRWGTLYECALDPPAIEAPPREGPLGGPGAEHTGGLEVAGGELAGERSGGVGGDGELLGARAAPGAVRGSGDRGQPG